MSTDRRGCWHRGKRCQRLPGLLHGGASDHAAGVLAAQTTNELPSDLPIAGGEKAKPVRLLPYRQGELDGLCGIYAVINAVRLALGDRGARITIADWQHLFTVMMAAADDRMGAYTATTFGIGTKQLLGILKAARQHLADEHELELSVRRVIEKGERLPLTATLDRLADLAAVPQSAVILSLYGYLDHWSVLKRITATSLELFDSYGFVRVAIANCRMKHEPAKSSQREHILHGRAQLCLTVRS